MGLGYATAAGIQGGFDSLHQLIAERQKQQLLATAAAEKQKQDQLQQAEFEERTREFNETNARLAEASGVTQARQKQQDAINEAGRVEKSHEIGDSLQPREAVALAKAGDTGDFAPQKIFTMPGLIEKLGGRAAPAVETGGQLDYGGTSAQIHQRQTEDLATKRYDESVRHDADTKAHQEKMDDDRERRYQALVTNQGSRGDARMDRSYNKEVSRVDAVGKPVLDRADRLQRLKISLDAQSPQADALIAPELLTAMAGGQGSGLRMNEAEIARIVGGRSKWESLKASLMQWSPDSSKALSITPDQRQQVRALVEAMSAKVDAKVGAIQRAHRGLIDAPDVITQRNVSDALAKELSDIDAGDGAAAGAPDLNAARNKYKY